MDKEQKQNLTRIIITAILVILIEFLPLSTTIRSILYLIPYFLIGYDVLFRAIKGILGHEVFDENFLMAIATIGAMALGEHSESVAVMLFYQIGELFQDYAVGKSRRNISELMDIRPDYANVEDNGKIVKTAPDKVAIGSTIIIAPGEKVPLDGVVTEGSSSLDTSALTGESMPRSATIGDNIISGCVNLQGVLHVCTTKEFGESTVSKILDLVENASSRKSKSENFITKFARYYTPAVCYSALALAVVPPLIRMLFMSLSPDWSTWIYRALTFLVISCPCALVISIPLTFFAGIGGASRYGILVKGSNYLEALAQTKTIVFDKTGTMTKGVFEVVGVHHNTREKAAVLEYAALAECFSSHPIAASIKKAYGKAIDPDRISDVKEVSGCGVIANVDKTSVAVGNSKLMEQSGIASIDCHKTGTVIHVAIGGEYAGHILIADCIKPTAAEAVRELHGIGVSKLVMLTGDRKNVADEIAGELGITDVCSELLPDEKVAKVEELLDVTDKSKDKLAFVGDGINDAPVLSRADIGIAMGALGSDAAIEAADIVLMDDDPVKIPLAIMISRKCLRIVYENIVFAIGVKMICLVLGALGIANMWAAIFADVGVMVIAVINSIRALHIKGVNKNA
ncbi:MAG: heavy metal translocating P-type ATPase [Lachnospiraceae bacterium]|jgi:Cd2+/Zn2+-exporting ATPase|nr:heavy metal translocating P-type ATPase [Lachnospiraceae bacterium]NLC73727.1 cadmium-translocating P-type ATPase [Clostridiales bacterium]